tara:strand:- start:9364 stop:9567 length:204 start_codon:yes stop_codon:yes gene_type:complete
MFITFTGFSSDNCLSLQGNRRLLVNGYAYNIVQITRQTWLLAVCDLIIEKAECLTPQASVFLFLSFV